MATRRRPTNPGQVPVTEVVARPVNTAVDPGRAGMPAQPVQPVAPTPLAQDQFGDYARLAQSLGSLSSSLKALGEANAAADRRRERRAAVATSDEEIPNWYNDAHIDSLTAFRTLTPEFNEQLRKGHIDISDSPAYKNNFSTHQGKSIAANVSPNDAKELEELLESGDASIRAPGALEGWWHKRTDAYLTNLGNKEWIPNKDRFAYAFLNARSRVFKKLYSGYQDKLKKLQRADEDEALQGDVFVDLESGFAESLKDHVEVLFDQRTLRFKEGKVNLPSTADIRAAASISKLADDYRVDSTMTSQEIHEGIGKLVINKIKNSESVEEIDFYTSVLKKIEIGPQGAKTKLMSGGSSTARLYDDEKGAIGNLRARLIRDGLIKERNDQISKLSNGLVNWLANERNIDKGGVTDKTKLVRIFSQIQAGRFDPNDPKNKGAEEWSQLFADMGVRVEGDQLLIPNPHSQSGAPTPINLGSIIDKAKNLSLVTLTSKNLELLQAAQSQSDGLMYGPEGSKRPIPLEMAARGLGLKDSGITKSTDYANEFQLAIFPTDKTISEEQHADRFMAALTSFRLLVRDPTGGRELAKNLIASDTNYELMSMVDILTRSKLVDGHKDPVQLLSLIRQGKLTAESVNEYLKKPSAKGGPTLDQQVDNWFSDQANAPAINSIQGVNVKDRMKGLLRYTLALGEVTTFDEAANAVVQNFRERSVTMDLGDNGGAKYVLSEDLDKGMVKGTGDPRMQRDPAWDPNVVVDFGKINKTFEIYKSEYNRAYQSKLAVEALRDRLAKNPDDKKARKELKELLLTHSDNVSNANAAANALRQLEGKTWVEGDPENPTLYIPDAKDDYFSWGGVVELASEAIRRGEDILQGENREFWNSMRGGEIKGLKETPYFQAVPGSKGMEFNLVYDHNGTSIVANTRDGMTSIPWNRVMSLARAVNFQKKKEEFLQQDSDAVEGMGGRFARSPGMFRRSTAGRPVPKIEPTDSDIARVKQVMTERMTNVLKNYQYRKHNKFAPVMRGEGSFMSFFNLILSSGTDREEKAYYDYQVERADNWYKQWYFNDPKLKEYKAQWQTLMNSDEGWEEFAMGFYPGIPSRKSRTQKTKGKDSEDYYMKEAVAAGIKPDNGHWPSRIDQGPNRGMILKKPNHPTFHKTIKGEEAAGMEWYYRSSNQRYYTFPKGEKVGKGFVKKKPNTPAQKEPLEEAVDIMRTLGNELLQNQPFGAEAVRRGRHARERIQNYLSTPEMEMMRMAYRSEDGAGTDFNHFALLFYPGPEEDLSHFPAETLDMLEQIGPVDKRSGIIQRAFELKEDEPLPDFAKENKHLREMRKFSQFSLRDINKQIDTLRKEEADRIERERVKAYKKTAKTGAMLPVDVEGVDTTPTLGNVEPPIQAIDPELSDLIDSPIDQYLQAQQLPFDVDSVLMLLNDEIPSESPEHINNQMLTEAEFPIYRGGSMDQVFLERLKRNMADENARYRSFMLDQEFEQKRPKGVPALYKRKRPQRDDAYLQYLILLDDIDEAMKRQGKPDSTEIQRIKDKLRLKDD